MNPDEQPPSPQDTGPHAQPPAGAGANAQPAGAIPQDKVANPQDIASQSHATPGAAGPLADTAGAAAPVRPLRGARPAPGNTLRSGLAGGVRALAANLRAALALLFLRRREIAVWRTGGLALLALFLLRLLIGLGYDFYTVGWRGAQFDPSALPNLGFWALAALLGSVALVALGARRPADPSQPALQGIALATAAFALSCWESLAESLLAVAADHSPALDRVYPLLSWIPLLWIALAFALAAVRLLAAPAAPAPALAASAPADPVLPAPGAALAGGPPAAGPGRVRRLALFIIAALVIIAPQWAIDPGARLWTAEAADAAGGEAGPDAAQSEQTLYGQFDLLNDALDAVVPGQEGVTELFTLSFAGDGNQDVFINEATGADAVMAEVFDSGEHSLILANSLARPQERPFATVSALERSLAEIADRMNPDEDVLALFLTSHGSPDHALSVALPPYQFEDLTPERLRSLLDNAGIRYRVIIVSSCYSGGFIDALSAPDTLVITASRADRTSFGCRDGEQWTDFGRAYFAEALNQSASFEGAFRIAKGRIAEREAKEGLTPSEPQIFVGPGIREQLQRLETRRGGRILFARAPTAPPASRAPTPTPPQPATSTQG